MIETMHVGQGMMRAATERRARAPSCALSQRTGASAALAEGQGAVAPGAARERTLQLSQRAGSRVRSKPLQDAAALAPQVRSTKLYRAQGAVAPGAARERKESSCSQD